MEPMGMFEPSSSLSPACVGPGVELNVIGRVKKVESGMGVW